MGDGEEGVDAPHAPKRARTCGGDGDDDDEDVSAAPSTVQDVPTPQAQAAAGGQSNPNPAKATTPQTAAIPKRPKHEKLLVLDLNGLFIDRRMKRLIRNVEGETTSGGESAETRKTKTKAEDVKDADAAAGEVEEPTGARCGKFAAEEPQTSAQQDPNEIVEDAKVGPFYVYNRPHMREFIEWVHDHFEVGVWSSANTQNTKRLVDYVWGAHVSKISFIWGQERCSNIGIPVESATKRKHPMFLKELKNVWSQKKKTGLARFNQSNTLLIDDSPYKAIRNPANTAIHPRGYTVYEMATDDMLSERGALRVYLEEMSRATSIPDFVKGKPWNGGEITEEQRQEIERAHRACEIAKEKEEARLQALRDPDEINLDDL